MLVLPPRTSPFFELMDEVLKLQGRMRTIFEGVSPATGLTTVEIMVLTAVVGAHSPPTVPQIGRSLGHARQVIQRAANSLVEKELIKTAPNPHHKRAPLLVATSKGEALDREVDACATRAAEKLLVGIDSAKCERVARSLRKLRGEIEALLKSERTK